MAPGGVKPPEHHSMHGFGLIGLRQNTRIESGIFHNLCSSIVARPSQAAKCIVDSALDATGRSLFGTLRALRLLGGSLCETLCVKPTLVVIGLSYRKAPVEVRERFWIGERSRYSCLNELAHSNGIDEIVVLATCSRSEFILWASDFSAAANAILRFLARHCGLRLCEWRDFYRLLDNEALHHVFRVTAGLDSMLPGEPEVAGQVRSAWIKAQRAGATGRSLDFVFDKALVVSQRVRVETEIGAAAVSVPYAAVELARQCTGPLEGRKALILGAGKMGELSARYLMNNGAEAVLVTIRTHQHALELAEKLHSRAIPFEQRWQHLEGAEIVIACSGCPHTILTREDVARIRVKHERRNVLLVDLAVPRNIDPAVKELPGVSLYNIDDLQQVVACRGPEQEAAAVAERIVASEVQSARERLAAEGPPPALAALRSQLDEVSRREIEQYKRDCGL